MNSVLPFSITGALFAYLSWVRMTGTTQKEEEEQLRSKFDGTRYVSAGRKMNPFYFNVIEEDGWLYRIRKNVLPFPSISGETEVIFEFDRLTDEDKKLEGHDLLEPYGIEEVEVNVEHNNVVVAYEVAEANEVLARIQAFQEMIEEIESSLSKEN